VLFLPMYGPSDVDFLVADVGYYNRLTMAFQKLRDLTGKKIVFD
jgi:hypothetical protein